MSKKVEEIYKKVTQIEHILLRPDTYIGSVESNDHELWIWEDLERMSFTLQEFSFCNGLYKIFDEILVNAADNYQRDHSTDRIAVNIEGDTISVENSGKGIPIQIHKEHQLYIPELIFGHLLTSSNYDDTMQKVTGGRNGFGAKLTNIFSTYFKVETADKGKKFTMVWQQNMSKHSEAEIVPYNGTSFTKVTFKPDLEKFKMDRLSDIYPLLWKRVMDLAGILPVKVFLNGNQLRVKNFCEYAQLYQIQKYAFTSVNKSHKWDVLVTNSDGQFQQVSFVNGINTIRGGTHVYHVSDQIVEGLITHIKKKYKELKNIKPFQVKSFIRIFVNCLIVNPAFDSQTKETLTTKPSQFGSSFELTDKFMDEIIKKTDLVDLILLQAKSKLNKQLSKQLSAKKQQRLLGIDKLEDANDAGTKNADLCTLILTEGDSAKSLAMAGIEIVGRDKFGVFPLRGKLLNVRDATIASIMKNAEIEQLVKIMGLQFNKTYDNVKSLRYGSIMIMTDQDHDGHHIKGLIINFIDKFWPSLLKMKGFLKQFVTPIIKITHSKETHSFFSISDYKKFINDHQNVHYTVKYYKGLGTSTDQEAQQYFSNLTLHRKTFTYFDQTDSDYIDLVFNKAKADQRKEWLAQYSWDQIQDTLDYTKTTVRYRNFINECLSMHSISDNVRSIASLVDGLKPTQRKIMHTLLNHGKVEYKVSTLCGLTMTYAQYHHGETSMQQTIVGMAQTFTGSNNINLLLPLGQFGTRSLGGKDAAQARYISTKLNNLSTVLFNEHDLHTLNYQDEEGHIVEPQWFVPILPLLLLNGADGIGTGWSTNVPPYNPREICQQLKQRMHGTPFDELTPWYRSYTGSIQAGNNQYILKGQYIQNKNTIYITEIPPKKTIKEYQAFIQSKMEGDEPEVLDLKEYHAGNKVCFEIKVADSVLKQDIEKYFKLNTTLAISNLVAFNSNGLLRRYNSVQEILEEFYNIRIDYYQKRKEYLLSKFQNELDLVTQKARFIEGMIDNSIKLRGQKKLDMCHLLQSLKFKGISQLERIKSTRIKRELDADNLEKQYDYLLGLSIWHFSEEKIAELKKQQRQLEQEISKLKKCTPEELWTEDLDLFLIELDKAEQQETQDTIKRVEKNVEKLVKGGAQLMRSLVLQGKDSQIDAQDYDSEDEQAKNPKTLNKVVKEFSNFGILSARNVPTQKLRMEKQEKQEKSKKQCQIESDHESDQQIEVELLDDSEQKDISFNNVKSKPRQDKNEEKPIYEKKKPQYTKKAPKATKLMNNDQYEDQEREKEKEKEKDHEKQCIPVEPLAVTYEDQSDQHLYKKYGLGDFLKYLTPTTDIGGNSLAERLLQRQKDGNIATFNTTFESAKKHQENDKKAESERKQRDSENNENFMDLIDFNFDVEDKPKESVQKTNTKPKENSDKKPISRNRNLKKLVLDSDSPEEEKPAYVRSSKKGRNSKKLIKLDSDSSAESGSEVQLKKKVRK